MKLGWIFLAALLAGASLAEAAPRKLPKAATACQTPNDCVLVPTSCCGSCDLDAAVPMSAYNGDWIEEHGQPGCDGAGCPRCAVSEDWAPQQQGQLIAACEAHRCVVKDLDHMPMTACSKDEQCVVATPRCCACTWNNSVAVRADAAAKLNRLVCAPGTGCPACAQVGHKPKVECAKGRCQLRPREPRAARESGR